MKIRKRIFWLIAIVALYCIWAVLPVSAHALLLRSVPETNAVLAQSPAQVELLFSEPLEAKLSTIKVYDSTGVIVDAGDSGVDSANSERMTVSLPALPNGVYSVAWQVVSQIDGHQTAGSFPFAVGSVDVSTLPAEQDATNTSLPISALIAKWLLLASVALLAGQFISILFIWNPALTSSKDEPGLSNRLSWAWENIYVIGLFGALLAIGLGVLSQAGQATGHELAFPWSKETGQVLSETRLGVIWLTRIVLVLIGFWLVRSNPPKWKHPTQFGIGLALLLTISLTSHAATELHPFFPVVDDWLHLIAMAFWFGGLAHLIAGLAILRKAGGQLQSDVTHRVVERFSLMAIPSVGVLGLTGLYSAGLRVGTIAALFDTTYGHSLLVKQIFVAALLSMAAVNLLIISPGLHRDSLQGVSNSPFIRRLGKTVLTEVILACFLLASVSVLTYLPPARTLPPKTTLIGTLQADDLKIGISISPGLVGQNDFTVQLSPAQSIQSVKTVLAKFIPLGVNLPPSEIDLTAQGDGLYTANGSYLSLPGEWLVEVTVRRENNFDAIVTFDFNLLKPGFTEINKPSIIPQISLSLIILIGLLFGLNLYTWGKNSTLTR